MKKIIISLLLITLTCNIIGMEQELDNHLPLKPEIWDNTPTDFSSLVLLERLNNTHKYILEDAAHNEYTNVTYRRAQQYITSISFVNKKFYAYANDPAIIRAIINNISCYCHQNEISCYLGTAGAINYVKQSECFYNTNPKTVKYIKRLIQQGADINYYPKIYDNVPYCNSSRASLRDQYFSDVMDSYRHKVSYPAGILLTQRHKGGKSYTLLDFAVQTCNIPIIKLVLEHKPRIKCVVDAVYTRNAEVMTLILQQEDIEQHEIEEAITAAQNSKNQKALQLIAQFFPQLLSCSNNQQSP